MSIVEALACGLPVVSTPVGGIPEAVKDRYNGLVVASGDPMDLADALQAVIEGGELYSCLKANARISVEERFDQHKRVEDLRMLFQEEAA